MKKLITILLIMIYNSIIALNFTITNPSFDQINEVCPGTIQHFDISVTGSYSSSDHLKIYIKHKLSGGGTSNTQVIFDTTFFNYFFNLPVNPDGSRTVYFNLPDTYISGDFMININLTPSHADGILCSNAISIKENKLIFNDELISMIDIYGKTVTEKKGLIILIYKSGKREKIFIESE